jgi:hypothetical protein
MLWKIGDRVCHNQGKRGMGGELLYLLHAKCNYLGLVVKSASARIMFTLQWSLAGLLKSNQILSNSDGSGDWGVMTVCKS